MEHQINRAKKIYVCEKCNQIGQLGEAKKKIKQVVLPTPKSIELSTVKETTVLKTAAQDLIGPSPRQKKRFFLLIVFTFFAVLGGYSFSINGVQWAWILRLIILIIGGLIGLIMYYNEQRRNQKKLYVLLAADELHIYLKGETGPKEDLYRTHPHRLDSVSIQNPGIEDIGSDVVLCIRNKEYKQEHVLAAKKARLYDLEYIQSFINRQYDL